jgi:hypothetical protein
VCIMNIFFNPTSAAVSIAASPAYVGRVGYGEPKMLASEYMAAREFSYAPSCLSAYPSLHKQDWALFDRAIDNGNNTGRSMV